MDHLIKLLQVLIILKRRPKTRSHDYISPTIAHIMIVLYQKMNNLPVWTMLKHNMAMFNEEAGELSFSILSRCVLGDTTKSKFDHLSDMYSLIHTFRELDNDLRDDEEKTGPKVNWRTRVKPDSEEVTGTSGWLGQMLRKIQYNQVTEYNGEKKGFMSLASPLSTLVGHHPIY